MKRVYDQKARPLQSAKVIECFPQLYQQIGARTEIMLPLDWSISRSEGRYPYAVIISITSPQSQPRRVHLNQIKKVVDLTGPASTLPSVPEERDYVDALPEEHIPGYIHQREEAPKASPTDTASGSPSHHYNLRPRNRQ